MPWTSLLAPALAWASTGVAGFVYTVIITRRMLQQKGYEPVAEDWTFHSVLPSLAYLGLPAAAAALLSHPAGALFGIAGSLLLLLAVGIHNAWDNVTFLVTLRRERLQLHAAGRVDPER